MTSTGTNLAAHELKHVWYKQLSRLEQTNDTAKNSRKDSRFLKMHHAKDILEGNASDVID